MRKKPLVEPQHTSIRVATDGDAKAIAHIHADSWRRTYRGVISRRFLSGLTTSALEPFWRERLSRNGGFRYQVDTVWVITADNQPVGFAVIAPCYEDDDLVGFAGEVEMLYIHPDHTGIGLGRQLLEHMLTILAKRGYYWVVIWVLEQNHHARQFYEAMGLQLDGGRRDDYTTGQPIPTVRYAKAINPAFDINSLFLTPSRK